MKAIVAVGERKVELKEMPQLKPVAGEVRIKTAAVGICATDFTMIDGCKRAHYPAILGHEWSGIIDAVGLGVDKSIVGSHCVAENVLKDCGEVGFEHPGGYGEYFITEAKNIELIPRDFPLTTAALIEPLAVSVRGITRLRLQKYDSAFIFGDGPIGLIMTMLLKREGVGEIVLAGGRPNRLKLARQLGAKQPINYHEIKGDLADGISKITKKNFPNVIEASGSAAAMKACLSLGEPCAHILMLGDYGEAKADFPWLHMLHKEYEIIGSNASAGAWAEAARLAVAREIPLEKLVTHTFAPEDYAKALELARSRNEEVIKVVIDWSKP